MRIPSRAVCYLLGVACFGVSMTDSRMATADAISPSDVVAKAVESDPWGMGGVEIDARAVTNAAGKQRDLSFDGKSLRSAGSLSKSLMHFKSPADVAGTKFLQLQQSGDDDERYLYSPDLKHARRIAAGTRSEVFMGTAYSYADVDRRDLRGAKATGAADETLGKYECYHVVAVPQNADAAYSKIEIWARKDNLVPAKMVMYAKGGTLAKTFVTKELQRHKDRWHITRSVMTDHTSGKVTEIVFEKVEPRNDIAADLFSVRNLEKN